MTICRDQLNTHLENVQGDLEALKEFLRGGDDYQVDANTLLTVSMRFIWGKMKKLNASFEMRFNSIQFHHRDTLS